MDGVRNLPHVRTIGGVIELELGAETAELTIDDARELCAAIAQRIKRAEYAADQVNIIKGWLRCDTPA